jgi:NAD(P)-dependent dehydrogenase (short-subunit alcohol dehydrogenase family)
MIIMLQQSPITSMVRATGQGEFFRLVLLAIARSVSRQNISVEWLHYETIPSRWQCGCKKQLRDHQEITMRLANKTALITGGNSGIGLETARLFVAEGARVAITGRDQAKLDSAVAELGPNAIGIKADATDVAALQGAVEQTVKAFGKIDIVFANAGIAGASPLGATELAAFEGVISTNLTSVFFTVQAAVPHLNDNASIILNGSVMSILGMPGTSAYAASKAGVRAMARVMASELSPRGIRVNVVSPGAIRTPIWASRAPTPEAFAVLEKSIARATPLGRIGEPEHISKTVLFLASDDAAHVQGQEIFVDGGATASPSGAPIYLS